MSLRFVVTGLAALAVAAAGGAAQASVTFSDGTFALADYELTPIFKTSASNIIYVSQCAACGNPGSALSVSQTYAVNGTMTVGFLNESFVYDPATQGAILGLTAAVQKDLTTNLNGANTFRPIVRQGDAYFMAVLNGAPITGATFANPVTTGYRDISGALTAASFTRFSFTTGTFGVGNPDFTAGELTFGFAQFSTLNAGAVSTPRFDNLRFEIESVPPAAAVPEPATWALMIGGFGLAGAALRRRRPLPFMGTTEPTSAPRRSAPAGA